MGKNKKIIVGLILVIILVGSLVVALKGFNVGLSLRTHDTFKFVFEQKYDLKDVKNICKEVFKGKDYRVRGVEIFDDAVYIEASSITEDEQKVLSEKLGNLYKQEATDENVDLEKKNYEFFNDSNIRLRDEVVPYILPVAVAALVVIVYTAIRFRKLNDGRVHETLLSLIVESIVLMLIILSIIAITRIPLEKIVFSVLIIAELIYLVIKFACMENKLKEI